MDGERQILHIDMNAFYASCHIAQTPSYAGKPIAVAGSPELRHGIIVTANYEARAFGVKTTMTVHEALRLCPLLKFIKPEFTLYRSYARKVFDIVRRFTPLVEVVSIDECYADVTGSKQFGKSIEIAQCIQQTIRDELQLPCSIGVAKNKFFAKMASNLQKPMGITEIDGQNVRTKLWPLPVEEVHGVGDKTASKLRALRIQTMGDIANASDERLIRALGVRGRNLKAYANGDDLRLVSVDKAPPKSVGHSITLPLDERDIDSISRVLLNLSDQVGRRLRKRGLVGRTLTVTIRYANRETIQRRTVLTQSTNLSERIYDSARELVLRHWQQKRAIRLLGVTLSDFLSYETSNASSVQIGLFDAEEAQKNYVQTERLERLTKVTDGLRDKFGEDIVIRGTMLKASDSNALRDHKSRGTSLQTDQLYDEE